MKTEIITLGVVDDHRLFRKALINLINGFQGYKVVLEANDGKNLQEVLKQSALPNILLLDLQMPEINGFETLSWLHKEYPEIKVIILSMCCFEYSLIKLMESGAKAFLTKDIDEGELCRALKEVNERGFYFSKSVTIKHLRILHDQNEKEKKQYTLTDREVLFLQLTCSDLTYKEIARRMNSSENQIEKLREALFEKLGVKSRVGLAWIAFIHGYIPA